MKRASAWRVMHRPRDPIPPSSHTHSRKIPNFVRYTKRPDTYGIRPLISDGASDRARTGDPRFTRAVLCQLSYAGDSMAERTEPFRRLSIVRGNALPRKCLTHGQKNSSPRTYAPMRRIVARARACIASAAASAAPSTLAWLSPRQPALLVTSVMPSTSIPSARAIMASHTVDIPT